MMMMQFSFFDLRNSNLIVSNCNIAVAAAAAAAAVGTTTKIIPATGIVATTVATTTAAAMCFGPERHLLQFPVEASTVVAVVSVSLGITNKSIFQLYIPQKAQEQRRGGGGIRGNWLMR